MTKYSDKGKAQGKEMRVQIGRTMYRLVKDEVIDEAWKLDVYLDKFDVRLLRED